MAHFAAFDPSGAPPQAAAMQGDPYAYFAAPQFAFAPAYPAAAPQPPADEVRTVFITGFPEDVKERELNNLMRFLPGYEASQMHFRNGQAQGFALFVNSSAARQSVDAVNNLVFDDGAVLRAEMAHKNMYIKEDPAAAKRSRPAFEAPPPPAAYTPYGAPPAPAPAPAAYTYATAMPAAAVVAAMQPRGYLPVTNTKDNPPCNTLFIGNLGDTVSEAELRGLFSHHPGFQQLKLVRGQKGISCFIEFGNMPTAQHVHDTQQGAVLASSDRGGIRIQYSKNPFGRKRDAHGNVVAEQPGDEQQLGQQQQQQQQQFHAAPPYAGYAQQLGDANGLAGGQLQHAPA